MSKDDVTRSISLIVPLYNSESYIRKTVTSLLSQECVDVSLILINDGSTDKSQDLIDEFEKFENVQIVKLERNLGESAAVNIGWELCQTEYVSIISADDPQQSNWLMEMFKHIESNPGYIFYYPDVTVIDSNDEIIGCITPKDYSIEMLREKFICLPSAGTIINKQRLSQDFRPRIESVIHPSDLVQWLNISKYGLGHKVPARLGTWRLHAQSLSYRNLLERANQFGDGIKSWAMTEEISLNHSQKLYLLGHQLLILRKEKLWGKVYFTFRNYKAMLILLHPKSYLTIFRFILKETRKDFE